MSLVRLIIYLFFSIIFTSCDEEENILVQDAVKLLDQEDVLFLDVRTPQEFKYEGGILEFVEYLDSKREALQNKNGNNLFKKPVVSILYYVFSK